MGSQFRSLPCGLGCHGANFGAKKGGYLLYISSKFAQHHDGRRPGPEPRRRSDRRQDAREVVLTSTDDTNQDDRPIEEQGMGGQGVLAVPLVYNGWVQNVPKKHAFAQLTCEQRNPIGGGGC